MENAMNTVLGTTVLILLILLIRRLFWKKCNPNILYFLWFFVAMRILLPVHIPLVLQNSLLSESILRNTSVYSYESSEDGKEVTERNELSDDEALYQPNEILDDTVLGGANVVSNNSSLPEFEDNTDNPGADTSNSDSEEITAPKAKPVIKPGTVFAVVWCLGSILMALYFILVNIYAFRNIEKTQVGRLQNKIDIYEAAGYNCLVGVFKPQIFLDSRILNNPQHKKFVLLHEMEHYKAKDNFWLIIRNLCLIVQWFNPFVWIAYFKVQEDCELACDYRVLSGLSKSEKESYAETLLYILESKQKRTAFASSAGNRKAVIKKRLQCVFEQRKTKWFRMLFLLMGVVTVTTFLKVTIKGKELDDTQIEKYEPEQEMVIQDDEDNATTIFVENMSDVARGKDLNCSNCYTTDISRAGNHYWIDKSGTLWGTGPSDYGQLGELRDDLSLITEPKEIARNVKHVDFSGEYFMIFLTNDNELYGLGGNPAGILQESGRENFNRTYMHDMNVITEPVLLMEDVVFAKCGYSTIIALKDNGDVYVMGNNAYSPFSEESYYEPEKVMENAKYVTSYFNTFAVICKDNSLWTWGDNRIGQCGIGSFSANEKKPQKVMEDVDCAWMGKVLFNGGDRVSEKNNLIVLKKNGDYYGCGIGIGTEMMYDGTNDVDEGHLDMTAKVAASNVFQRVRLQEFEKNYWYQRTKLVTKDMETRELTETEIENLVRFRQELFAGLSDEEIAGIIEKISAAHGSLESDIVYQDYGTLTDPNPDYWQSFNDTNPDDNYNGGHWGPETIQDLEDVKGKLSDVRVINLITEAQNEIQAIMDKRNGQYVMNAHMILHDLDYWLFRCPPEGFEWAPADWSGIQIYYKKLDGILYDYIEQDVAPEQDKMIQKYEAILADVIEGKSPDGDGIYMEPPMGTEYYENKYAIYDVDGDGRQELIISYLTASMAGKWECIFDYNPATEEVSREFLEFPALTYYDNGIIKAEWSHNQGKGPDFWPFTLYSYDSDTDSYIEIGAVDTWDKKYFPQNNDGTPFPDDADIDGDGIVYTIRDGGVGDESFYKIWQDGAEYEKWYQSIVGEGSELSIPWKVLENK